MTRRDRARPADQAEQPVDEDRGDRDVEHGRQVDLPDERLDEREHLRPSLPSGPRSAPGPGTVRSVRGRAAAASGSRGPRGVHPSRRRRGPRRGPTSRSSRPSFSVARAPSRARRRAGPAPGGARRGRGERQGLVAGVDRRVLRAVEAVGGGEVQQPSMATSGSPASSAASREPREARRARCRRRSRSRAAADRRRGAGRAPRHGSSSSAASGLGPGSTSQEVLLGHGSAPVGCLAVGDLAGTTPAASAGSVGVRGLAGGDLVALAARAAASAPASGPASSAWPPGALVSSPAALVADGAADCSSLAAATSAAAIAAATDVVVDAARGAAPARPSRRPLERRAAPARARPARDRRCRSPGAGRSAAPASAGAPGPRRAPGPPRRIDRIRELARRSPGGRRARRRPRRPRAARSSGDERLRLRRAAPPRRAARASTPAS